MFCSNCGKEIDDKAVICVHCGCETRNRTWINVFNNHNKSCNKEIPEEIKHFNWGAFCLTWIWGLFNKTYIALFFVLFNILSLVMCKVKPIENYFKYDDLSSLAIIGIFSVISFVFQIWLGINGNELAWKNKKWKDIKQFNNTQRKWAKVGAIIYFLGLVFTLLPIVFYLYLAINGVQF